MHLPDDPEKRCWVELAGPNPELANSFKRCLVSFLAFDHARVPGLAGTGFVVGTQQVDDSRGTEIRALVLTAKHVLTEGVTRIQRPDPIYAPSALFVPPTATNLRLHAETVRAVWMGSNGADVLHIWHLAYNTSIDIACGLVAPQTKYLSQFEPLQILLDTTTPNAGEIVHMVSQGGMDISDRVPPAGTDWAGQAFTVQRRVSIRRGVVTGTYPDGFRQYKWPCFTTSIPVEPGMSGGLVYLPRHGEPTAACGVVCADASMPEAHSSLYECGESVVACAWPALSLTVPEEYANDSQRITLFELMKRGHMQAAIGGIDNIRLRKEPNGDMTITKMVF
ncbi:MAG: trypsin-like peptidase domain-containing protein [Burkholderiales bacterium]|nr:trypsin-like peptidase domain-containing protein [Burkholderiales bacterium]